MYTYVNKFNFVTNNAGTEVMISFKQTAPVFSEDSKIESTPSVPVADIAMTPQLAKELAEKLLAMFEEFVPESQE